MKRYLNIDGTEKILEVYGEWPSFHDAEVISFCLDRNKFEGRYGPTITINLHCFEITNQIENRHYKTIKHNLITFVFYDLVEFELQYGFGQQNPLSGFTIIDISSDQLENIRYKVGFDAHLNCDLHFKCSKIKILSIEEGIPIDSGYK